jgi:hypothetical protein
MRVFIKDFYVRRELKRNFSRADLDQIAGCYFRDGDVTHYSIDLNSA